jgi:hypothetical protein
VGDVVGGLVGAPVKAEVGTGTGMTDGSSMGLGEDFKEGAAVVSDSYWQNIE